MAEPTPGDGMLQMTGSVLIAVVLALSTVSTHGAASAQPAGEALSEPAVIAETRLPVGDREVELVVTAVFEGGWEMGVDGAVISEVVPFEDRPVLVVEPVGDAGSPVVVVVLRPALPTVDATETRLLLELDATQPARLLWREAYDALATPADIVAHDLDGDGQPEIVMSDRSTARPCGGAIRWERPRVLDRDRARFRPVRITPAWDDGAPELTPEPTTELGDPIVRFDRGWFASAAGDEGESRRPLSDGDSGTGWRETELGGGEGDWLQAVVPETVALVGIDLAPGGTDLPGPTRLLVSVDDGRGFVVSPESSDLQRYRFPEPIETRCVMVTIIDAGGAESVGIAELHGVTAVDELGGGDRLVEVWATAIERACDDGRPSDLAFAVDALREDLDLPDPGSPLAEALLLAGSECSANALTPLLVERDADAEIRAAVLADGAASPHAAEAVIGTLRGADSLTALVEAALTTTDPVARDRLLGGIEHVAGASLHGELAALAPLLVLVAEADADAAERVVALAAYAEAEALAGLVRSLDGRPDHDTGLLRAAAALPTRSSTADEEIAAGIATAITHDNGTVARLAIVVAGRQGLTALAPSLVNLAANDASPHLRAAAVAALGQLDTDGADESIRGALDDPSPAVRLVAARTRAATATLVSEPSVLAGRLGAEPWPEVRAAVAAAAAEAGDAAADDALLAFALAADADDAAAVYRALASRQAPLVADLWPHVDRWRDERGVFAAALGAMAVSSHACDADRLSALASDPAVDDQVRRFIEARLLPECRP